MITYTNTNMKKFRQKNCRKMFLEAIFSHSRKLFSELPYKIFVTALHDIIGQQNFALSFCQSLSKLRCVICTAVILFAPVLHLNCTALSQSESSNFFMCIITCRDTLLKLLTTRVFPILFVIYLTFFPLQRPQRQTGNSLLLHAKC